MIRRLLSWLWRGPALGYVPGWDAVRAERELAATERLLLGAAGKATANPTAAQRARRRPA